MARVSSDGSHLSVVSPQQAEARLDEALEMTFPASDPVAIFSPDETRHDDQAFDLYITLGDPR